MRSERRDRGHGTGIATLPSAPPPWYRVTAATREALASGRARFDADDTRRGNFKPSVEAIGRVLVEDIAKGIGNHPHRSNENDGARTYAIVAQRARLCLHRGTNHRTLQGPTRATFQAYRVPSLPFGRHCLYHLSSRYRPRRL